MAGTYLRQSERETGSEGERERERKSERVRGEGGDKRIER